MKKPTTTDSYRSVRGGWVMTLAAYLQEEHNLGLRQALKMAHASRSLLDELHLGIVEFAYREKDGTTRKARGTLKKGISPAFDSYVSKGKGNRRDNNNTEGVYTYWDLDCNGFRSFKSINLIAL